MAAPFVALALFSGVTSLAFGISAGKKAKRAREEQARVEAENAARAADRMLNEDLPQMMGKQRVAIAKSGAEMSGTPFAMMMDTARRMARDAGDIRSRGVEQAQYLRQQGRAEQKQQLVAGFQGAVNAGISAAQMQSSASLSRGTNSSFSSAVPNVERNFNMPRTML